MFPPCIASMSIHSHFICFDNNCFLNQSLEIARPSASRDSLVFSQSPSDSVVIRAWLSELPLSSLQCHRPRRYQARWEWGPLEPLVVAFLAYAAAL
jgi:hypothetical protein